MRLLIAFAAMLACVPCGCIANSSPDHNPGPLPVLGQQHMLRLESDGDHTLRIEYSRADSSPSVGPRVVEILLQLQGEANLTEYDAGAALVRAGKTLTVQDKGEGLYRVVALSASSASEVGAGTLATLSFDRSSPAPVVAEILTDRPMFAPQEAQVGLIVGDPIEF